MYNSSWFIKFYGTSFGNSTGKCFDLQGEQYNTIISNLHLTPNIKEQIVLILFLSKDWEEVIN